MHIVPTALDGVPCKKAVMTGRPFGGALFWHRRVIALGNFASILVRRVAVRRWFGWHFGEIYRELKATGQLIGANDLWIAATARAYGVSLVTSNYDDFARIKGIKLYDY